MAQLTDDCFAFSGPLLRLDDMERLIGERVTPVAEIERVPLHGARGRVVADDVKAPVDLVLVEGFKRDAFPKLEIHRAANGKPLIHPDDPHIVAIAADIALPQAKIPVIDLNNVEAIADLLLKNAAPVDAINAAARGA